MDFMNANFHVKQCTLCEKEVCKACINPGWILNKYNICTTQCGDVLVIDPYEQCDDGNDIPQDVCYECNFHVHTAVLNICDYQHQLDIKISKCLKKNNLDDNDPQIDMQLMYLTNLRCGENQIQCGNGVLINQYEECDDGNNYGGNGCSNLCKIEDSYQCMNQQGLLSLCTYILAPEFHLNILSETTNQIQIIELMFTQYVKLKETLNLEDIIVFTIFHQFDIIQSQKAFQIQQIPQTILNIKFKLNLWNLFNILFYKSKFKNILFLIKMNQVYRIIKNYQSWHSICAPRNNQITSNIYSLIK